MYISRRLMFPELAFKFKFSVNNNEVARRWHLYNVLLLFSHSDSVGLLYNSRIAGHVFARFFFPRVNQAALRVVLKLEDISSSVQATQISVRFVCVYASSTLPSIAVSNCFSRCLDHCFCSFRPLFESISINYRALELNYFVFKTFYLLPFLAFVSGCQGPFSILHRRCLLPILSDSQVQLLWLTQLKDLNG